jgi:hypothetical protein
MASELGFGDAVGASVCAAAARRACEVDASAQLAAKRGVKLSGVAETEEHSLVTIAQQLGTMQQVGAGPSGPQSPALTAH